MVTRPHHHHFLASKALMQVGMIVHLVSARRVLPLPAHRHAWYAWFLVRPGKVANASALPTSFTSLKRAAHSAPVQERPGAWPALPVSFELDLARRFLFEVVDGEGDTEGLNSVSVREGLMSLSDEGERSRFMLRMNRCQVPSAQGSRATMRSGEPTTIASR